MSAPPAAAVALPEAGPSRLYKLVMTPLIFVSFLFSLALVEFRYTLQRSHIHGDPDGPGAGSGAAPLPRAQHLPPWLHHILYRQEPVRPGPPPPSRSDEDAYYHSMQRKLLKMEADEAFRIRTTVLGALGLLAAGTVWLGAQTVWWAATWARQRG